MATKSKSTEEPAAQEPKSASTRKRAEPGSPQFPYSTTIGALRRILENIPDRPKPPKLDIKQFNSWGIGDKNAYTIVRVFDAIGLTNSGVPNDNYERFMVKGSGPGVLGSLVKTTYKKLFDADHAPYADNATLKRLFNTYGGTTAEATLKYMRDTFKALCDYADFNSIPSTTSATSAGPGVEPVVQTDQLKGGSVAFVINLHIHLPEGKTTRDYEHMFEDIGKYLLQLKSDSNE
ncbi:MAG: DUF5343 domain-containing protein [Armatimonadetes bacterium]|nr:DUF5343 domain-containing protein [Armatimonadota bacterium]